MRLTLLSLLCATTYIGQKRHFGNYFNKWRYRGLMFVFKSDSTFEYTNWANAGPVSTTEKISGGTLTTTKDSYFFYDSGYGSYKIINDTVSFSYNTDTIEGEFNGYNIRPPKLYWKGKALYYVHPNTGAVLKRKGALFDMEQMESTKSFTNTWNLRTKIKAERDVHNRELWKSWAATNSDQLI